MINFLVYATENHCLCEQLEAVLSSIAGDRPNRVRLYWAKATSVS